MTAEHRAAIDAAIAAHVAALKQLAIAIGKLAKGRK